MTGPFGRCSLLLLLLLPSSVVGTVYDVAYGFFQIEICPGDTLRITWEGYHNIAETQTAECNSDKIADIEGDHSEGYQIDISAETLLSDTPGETRYFKCDYHCGDSSSRFEVTHGLACSVTASPTVSDMVCVAEDERVLLENGTYGRIESIVKGDVLRRSDGKTTTVRRTVRRVHEGNVSYFLRAGTCGARRNTKLTPNHAVRCASELNSPMPRESAREIRWWHVADIGLRVEHPVLRTAYVNLQTEDYCEDDMILESGAVVETWDGRGAADARSHFYTDEGDRTNCKA